MDQRNDTLPDETKPDAAARAAEAHEAASPETPSPWPNLPQGVKECWDVAAGWLRVIFCGFGNPGALADQRHMPRGKWRDLSLLLREAETMVRHVLLVLALWNPHSGEYETKKRRRLGAGGGGPGGSSAWLTGPGIDPQYWRVRFTLPAHVAPGHITSAGKQAAARRTAPVMPAYKIAAPSGFVATLASAERLEKLLRVMNDPEPYAKRLRARLRPHLFRPDADPDAQPKAARNLVLRLMQRPGSASERLGRILSLVLPSAEKLARPYFASD